MNEEGRVIFVKDGQPKLVHEVGSAVHHSSGYIELCGADSLLYAGRMIGGGDFRLKATLTTVTHDTMATFVIGADRVGLPGFRRLTHDSWSPEMRRHQHLPILSEWLTPATPFRFELVRFGQKNALSVNGATVKHFIYGGNPFGIVGFGACAGGLRIHDFWVEGETAPREA